MSCAERRFSYPSTEIQFFLIITLTAAESAIVTIEQDYRRSSKHILSAMTVFPVCPYRNGHRTNGAGRRDLEGNLERVMGIEPTYSAWKAAALPLSYTRIADPYKRQIRVVQAVRCDFLAVNFGAIARNYRR